MKHIHHFVYPPQGSVAPDERGRVTGVCACGRKRKGFASFEAWTKSKRYGRDYGDLTGDKANMTYSYVQYKGRGTG